MKVSDIMSKDPLKVEADTSVHDAAKLMVERGVGSMIIVSGVRIVGIVTERDLVSRVLTESFDPTKVLIKDIMTTPLFTVSSNDTVGKAADLMVKYKVRRLPVVDTGRLIGLLSAYDFAKALADEGLGEKAMLDAMSRHSEPPSTGPYK